MSNIPTMDRPDFKGPYLRSSADALSFFVGINDIARSASAVIVSDGFTPGLADIAAPSIT